MKKMKKVELYRLLENNLWDTIVVTVDAAASRKYIEAKVIPELMKESQHRKTVLMGIYNDCLEQEDPA